uniref:Uncharacterized protein n=1 Tax=uncultured euryarchaeote Rifle_16ft_4_minimus_309 TaxID=1665192 RepID=A0A0H4T2U3_9EURY|nr:hypothetical protein [uncultured euryarchaeote Rifle_16ft_4_minimus_309]
MDEALDLFELDEPMPCYEFNDRLGSTRDDGRCMSCRKFLTIECPYIDRFLGEDGE